MPQKLLNSPQRHARNGKPTGERVPQRMQCDAITLPDSWPVQTRTLEQAIHRLGQVTPKRAVGAMEDEVDAQHSAIPDCHFSGLPTDAHRLNCSSRLWAQRNVSILVVLDVESQIGLSLNLNEPMDDIDIGELEHGLLSWTQAGVTGEHQPLQSISE